MCGRTLYLTSQISLLLRSLAAMNKDQALVVKQNSLTVVLTRSCEAVDAPCIKETW